MTSIAVVVPVSAQADDEQLDQPFWSGQIPWRRTAREVRAEFARLTAKADDLVARDPDPYDDVDRMLTGIAAAAWWTTGEIVQGPMTREPAVLDGPGLVREVTLAQATSSNKADPNWPYALGVSAWLGWLAGALDRVLYPDES